MKKLIFSILPAFLFAFISCMNMSSGSGENGSVRVALPGSGRATYTYSKNNAGKFIVRLYNDDFDQTEEGAVGGVIEFGDLEPGKYTATAEAWNAGENILEGSGSTEITVRAGETTDCNIAMILEGQTAYYSKYMILTDYSNVRKLYNYTTMQEIYIDFALGEDPYNPVEDREGKIYYIRDNTLHRNGELLSQIETSNLIKNPLYYDSKTDSLWLASFESNFAVKFLVFKNPSAATSNTNPSTILYDDSYYLLNNSFSCQAFAVKEDNIYIACNNSNILLAKKDTSISNTEPTITLSNITPALSGEVTDMAVLEDGTVAVLVNEKSLNPANQFTLNDGCTVYSRGALVLLSSDLSTYKVYGWTDSPRTIRATEDTENPVKEWTSITAYIPDYAERNSHFYGPMRIVAIRPKELVIADCGANFVLADYKEHRQGKMFTHNRLMTVNLRNFAIGCKKEFSEDELKFQNLSISGNIEVSTSGDWSNKYVDEK